MTADSDFIYLYQKDQGLHKFGYSDSVDTKIGYLYKKNSGMSGDGKYFMYFNGRLYCRGKNSDKKPFSLINRETLEEIEDDEDFNKKIEALHKKDDANEEEKKEDEEKTNILEWTKEDDDTENLREGRYLCESPLFTDGQNIYVISTHREIKITPKEEEDLEENKKELIVKKWFLEIYDGETWELKDTIELKLDIKTRGLDDVVSEAEEKETDNIKQVRESFGIANITNCSFVTNGMKLLVGEGKKWHIYDLKELKWTFNLSLTSDHWGFDYETNTYLELTSDKILRSFKIPAFKTFESSDGSSFKGIIEYINSKVNEVQEMHTVKDKIGKASAKSIFQNLRKRAEEQKKEISFSSKTRPEYTKFLLMNILKEGSKDLISRAEKINPQGAVGEDKLSIYRGSYSTTISSTFFNELLNAIEGSIPLLVKKEKGSSNLLEQYNLYMLFILFRTSMMCLSKLNLSLSTVLADKKDYDRFLKIIESHISVIVSKEKLEYTYEEGKYNAELETLWGAIQNECRAIMAFCLSLVYESLSDLMGKVSSSLDKLEIGEVDNSLGIYIRYLTLPETMNKALNDSDIKDMILVIYEKLCDKKTRKLVSAVESVKYETHDLKSLEYNSLEKNSEGFIYSVTQNIINKYFEANKELEIEKDKEKSDKDKVEKLERKVELKELDLIKVLERISDSAIKILEICTKCTQTYLDEAIKQQKADEEIKDEDKKSKKTGSQKYIEFHRYLYKVAKENNNFTNLMHVYVTAFASLKDSINVKTLSLLSIKILRFVETFSTFKEVKSDNLSLSDSDDLFRKYLDNDVVKFFVWTISKISYSFINVSKVTEMSEKGKMDKVILDSKLLSGGMESRFLGILSKDTVDQLKDMCEVTGDRRVKGYLTEQPEEIDDDELYLQIIHHGKNENVDRIIELFQFNLERKHIWAKAGKEEGMRLSRAAFACMIKISGLSTDFFIIMDEMEMQFDSMDPTNETKAKKELAKKLSEIDIYKETFKRYESAARMRAWFQEKKKSWAEKIRKVEEKKKKKEEDDKEGKGDNKEEKKEEKKDEKKEDKKDKKEEKKVSKEEVIDTSTNTKDAPVKAKYQIELAKIVEKVIEKAEFMLKLELPTQWGTTSGVPELKENMSEIQERDKAEQDIEEKGDWLTKLNTWKDRQSEHLGGQRKIVHDAHVYSSSVTSILACLQAPISSQRIKKQIETIYVNTMKRICGFRLIARLTIMQHNMDTCIEYLNWFCSSLRHNTNVLAHYTDGISGCGEHLKNELRKSFFVVFNGIVKQLKTSTDHDDIKFLLNCCKWQFTASDHESLIRSGIFEVLSEGNGKKEKGDNPIKYCWGHKFKYNETENYPLCQDILDLFEQVLIACFARIIKSDSGEEQKVKSSGTSIPTIERAQSSVNTTTTEALIASGFKHIFGQLDRYIKLTKKFKGIDWGFYVSKRNSQREKNGEIEEITENELADETPEEEINEDNKKEDDNKSDNGENTEKNEEEKKDETKEPEGETKEDEIEEDKKEEEPEEDNKEEEPEEKGEAEGEGDKDEGEGESDKDDDEDGGEEEEVKDEVQEKLEEKENNEIKKIKKLYENKYIFRFLKLIEIFTSIAANQEGVLGMVLKVARPQELTILTDLLVYAPPRHGFTIVKILDNLIRVKIPHELFDESVKRLAEDSKSIHYRIMNKITPINKFEKTPFLKFLYNYVISIRSSMWNDSRLNSNGSFILSNKILSLLRTILNNDLYGMYKREIILAIDHLIDHSDDYDLEELEPLLSIMNGGEYLGLGLGTSGVSSDGTMFTVLGFVKKWYGVKNPGDGDDNNENNSEESKTRHKL